MKKVALVVVIALCVALVAWRTTRTSTTSSRTTNAPPTEPTASSRVAPPAPPDAAPPQVRKLSSDDRVRLETQIRAAIARSTSSAGRAPSLEAAVPVIPLEEVGGPLKQALEDAISVLAECYGERAAGRDAMIAVAQMTLITDPELGTVIDTDDIKDESGAKLDPKIDTCLRDTMDSLALPPLGKPGKVNLQYSFRFE